MRPDLEHYYLIDQYLENKLTGNELAAFEDQLIQDTDFASDVHEQRMLNNLILEAELKDLRSTIEKDLLNIQKPSFFRMHWQWISVGTLCLLGVSFFVLRNKKDAVKYIQESPVAVIEQSKKPGAEPAAAARQDIKKPALPGTVSKTAEHSVITRISIIDTVQAIKHIDPITPEIVPVTIKTEPPIETKNSEENKKTDCSFTKITCAITTESSCMQTETGSIYIDKIAGGNAPYIITVNNKKIKEKNISALGAGMYDIKISDRNGCFSEQKATILEKSCIKSIQQGTTFNINPTIGETCSIAFDTNKKGNMTIYNRGGKIVYRITNPPNDYIEWNGTDGYGALAEAGLYVYIIEYTDGTKVTGEVNITR